MVDRNALLPGADCNADEFGRHGLCRDDRADEPAMLADRRSPDDRRRDRRPRSMHVFSTPCASAAPRIRAALQRRSAYRNRPLPIGGGQTISQPTIVALMTDLLQLKPDDKVLEIGTGCGYQAAVLAELVRNVYTIEIVASLGRAAAKTLARLNYANVHARIGDGYKGWPDEAPFDAIIVTAAPDHIPPALIDQLKPGGRLVIPVGTYSQELMVVRKQEDGSTLSEQIVPVRFVPLTREEQ
jgi:protein-L-isoaspartate(D-aspartate) O-methyltransferase